MNAQVDRADWHRATEKDRPHDAVKALVELEKLEPKDPQWSQRLGESYRRVGKTKDAVLAYERAFERYFSTGHVARAIAMAKLVRTLDAARGDLLERSLPQTGRGAPPPLSFGGLPVRQPPPLPSAARSGQDDPTIERAPELPARDHAAGAPAKVVVKPPPLPVGDGPKPARTARAGDVRPPPLPAGDGPKPARTTSPLAVNPPPANMPPLPKTPSPLPATTADLKIVRPATLARASDSSVDEVRFEDAPESSIEILLVEFMGSDAIEIEVEEPEPDVDDDDVPPTRPVDQEPSYRATSRGRTPSGARDTYASLATVRLFAALSRDALLALADAAELVEFVPGAMIIVRDERAFALYAIVSGSVFVLVPGSPDIELGEGDVFGEASLLEEGKRQADVKAASELMTLRIERARLEALTRTFPEIADALFDLLARRLVTNLMHTSPLFTAFEPAIRLELAQKFEVRRAEPGTVLAERGRRSDGLYVLLAGDVMVEPEDGAPTRIARGTAFGHASLLGSASSDVTIRASTEAVLLRMSAAGFGALAALFPPALAHLAETAAEPLPESTRRL